MDLTTENIDEWCFKYLEKDLNKKELDFFEKELESNPLLSKQVSLWNKTIVKAEPLTQVDYNVANNLFRYKNQFLFVLIEFVLTTSIALFLICNSTKDIQAIETLNAPNTDKLTSSENGNNDTVFINDIQSNKANYKNLLLDTKNDSEVVLKEDKKGVLELDTIIQNTNHFTSTPKELNKTDSTKITSDTSVAQKKSTQNKNTTRSKYRGSRLIPINNDL